MRKLIVLLSIAVFAILIGSARLSPKAQLAESPKAPKLIVIIIIDQFRPDYLVRFRPEFVAGGFNLLLSGADFVDCRYQQALTATGPGHATLLTGAYPDVHGIIGNVWFDRNLGRAVNCVEDPATKLVDDSGTTSEQGASPHYLVGSTLGDELRAATDFGSRVISISLKDRGAILPGGHTANAAYWYSSPTGQFVTSTYYMPSLPPWVVGFNSQQQAKTYCGKSWTALPETPGGEGRVFSSFTPSPDEPCPDANFLAWLDGTPFMNELELNFAQQAIRNERLGQGQTTDILTISLSANDYIGHQFGPYSPELADMTLRTDRYLADLFDFIEKAVGLKAVWIALSADHGVAPTPKFIREHHLGIGQVALGEAIIAVNRGLSDKFGNDEYVQSATGLDVYLNYNTLRKHNVPEDQAEAVAAEAASAVPGVRMVLTRQQLLQGRLPQDRLAWSVARSFFGPRSGDLYVVPEPFAVSVPSETETTHGTPWNYDSNVPLLLWGSAFKPGTYATTCHTIDLASTLAVALGINQPSGSEGRPLLEALSQ